MMTALKQFSKKFSRLSTFGVLVLASVLSVVMGCGGADGGSQSSNSAFTVDITGSGGGSPGLVSITIRNTSANRSISQVTFLKSPVEAVLDDPSTPQDESAPAIPAKEVVRSFSPSIPPGGSVAGAVLYNAPTGNYRGSVTTAVVASDSTGRFSQGYNLKLEFGTTTVKITPSDGIFYFQ